MSNYEFELHIGAVNRAERIAAAVLAVACIGCVIARHLTGNDLFGDLAWAAAIFAVMWGLRIDVTASSPARHDEPAP